MRRGRSADRRKAQREAGTVLLDSDNGEQADRIEQLTHELALSEARFRDVIERNADAIVVVDTEGTLCFANTAAAKLFGTPVEQLQGHAFGFPVVAGETTEVDLLRNGSPTVVEMRVVESQWEGKPACIASLRDITERKRAEQSARQLIWEQAARSVAEQSARRFRFLAESSAVLSSSLDYSATLAELARVCVKELSDWAAVYCIDENGRLQRLEVAHRDPAKADVARQLREHKLPAEGLHPVLDALESGRSILVKEIDDAQLASIASDKRHLELLSQLGITSYMLVPMMARGRALGALALVCSDPECRFHEQDLALAEDLGARAALAIDNAKLYHDARAANQTKSELLAVISHDLRTPLNSIIGYSQLLQMGIPEELPPVSRERVERIVTSAKHQLYLIDQLLAFARLDAHQQPIRFHEIDLRTIASEVAELMEPLAQERGLTLESELPSTELLLPTDPDKVRQVLINLVANAVNYTPQGTVRIQIEDAGDQARLHVHDTGIGIAPEHLPHIFEPFWQVNRNRRALSAGTGLGLSVVHRVIQLLGGAISVQSTVGEGSLFTVTLPKQPPAAESQQ